MSDNNKMTEDPMYQAMLRAMEDAKAYNLTPIAVSVNPLGIPVVVSPDAPPNTIAILQPKRMRFSASEIREGDDGRPVIVFNIKPEEPNSP